MKRQKDNTPHTCKICKQVVPASGMGSHLYHKHNKIKSDDYAKQYGEFRQKYINKQPNKKYSCKACSFVATSHKHLSHHIQQQHGDWKDYIIKYIFKGEHPTCKCGCGQKVKLLRHGRSSNGQTAYARDYITGHDTKTRQLGYRSNTEQQKLKMRQAAIERMKKGKGTYYDSGPSKSEQQVASFIKSLGLQVQQSDRNILSGLEVDIVVPSKKIAIEFNGSYFHSDLFKHKRYHLNKTKELNNKGYRVVHIWEVDWYNNRKIVESLLRSICGKIQTRIYARETNIQQISREDAAKFLDNNHLQGNAVGRVFLGAYHKGQLVQVMTFSKLRAATGRKHKQGSFELLRYATKTNIQVVGGASKLFNFFIQNYKPNYILSYAKRDWSEGNLYKALAMSFAGNTPPGYCYVKSRKRFSRFQFQKHKLVQDGADPNLTEYQIMLQNGYHRVWDCGNLKFEWTNT